MADKQPHDDDQSLLRAARAGDKAALGELLQRYHKRVYHVCLRTVHNPDDAAEVAQETLLRAIRSLDTFREGSKFSTWLLRIAMNQSISLLRKKKVRAAASLEAIGESADDPTGPSRRNQVAGHRELSPPQSVETNEQLRLLAKALESIELPLRTVLMLRDLQGLDYQQIADVLSLPVGTVKSRLFRARLALRQAMGAESGDESIGTAKVQATRKRPAKDGDG